MHSFLSQIHGHPPQMRIGRAPQSTINPGEFIADLSISAIMRRASPVIRRKQARAQIPNYPAIAYKEIPSFQMVLRNGRYRRHYYDALAT